MTDITRSSEYELLPQIEATDLISVLVGDPLENALVPAASLQSVLLAPQVESVDDHELRIEVLENAGAASTGRTYKYQHARDSENPDLVFPLRLFEDFPQGGTPEELYAVGELHYELQYDFIDQQEYLQEWNYTASGVVNLGILLGQPVATGRVLSCSNYNISNTDLGINIGVDTINSENGWWVTSRIDGIFSADGPTPTCTVHGKIKYYGRIVETPDAGSGA